MVPFGVARTLSPSVVLTRSPIMNLVDGAGGVGVGDGVGEGVGVGVGVGAGAGAGAGAGVGVGVGVGDGVGLGVGDGAGAGAGARSELDEELPPPPPSPPLPPTETLSPTVPLVVPPDAKLATARYFACEIGPRYPTAGTTPFADCHLATAALVMGPKYPVAPPAWVKWPVSFK